jgi:hypothetical protein
VYRKSITSSLYINHTASNSLISQVYYDILAFTIVLPVVLYSCETWYLTLKEESKLRLFENRILRRIFGHKRDENKE